MQLSRCTTWIGEGVDMTSGGIALRSKCVNQGLVGFLACMVGRMVGLGAIRTLEEAGLS